jgi:hypothetical protein
LFGANFLNPAFAGELFGSGQPLDALYISYRWVDPLLPR